MQLNELFDKDLSPRDYNITVQADDKFIVNMKVGDKQLTVACTREDYKFKNWDIVFNVDGSTKLTGGGGEIKIFSAVVNLLKLFFTKYKPQTVNMMAEQRTRANLYARMLKRSGYFKRVIILNADGNAPNLVAATVNSAFPVTIEDGMAWIHVTNAYSFGILPDGEPEEDLVLFNGVEEIFEPEIEIAVTMIADDEEE